MKKRNASRRSTALGAALLGVVVLAACQDAPTDPLASEFDDLLTPAEEVELAILSDGEAVEAAVAVLETPETAAMRRGMGGMTEARSLAAAARARFDEARAALARGEKREALALARQARGMIVTGLERSGGAAAVASLVEHVEDLAMQAAMGEDTYDDPAAAARELADIAAHARASFDGGDVMGGGMQALMGEQRARQRRGDTDRGRDRVRPWRAELAVALGATAVELAERLLDNRTDVAQERLLATAHEFLQKAREAFDAGHYARAVHFADWASWSALKAVVLPGGITEEEQRAMLELAKELHEDAVVAVGDAPTELQRHLLEMAGRLIEAGEEALNQGHVRGVAALWRSAVISSWLIG